MNKRIVFAGPDGVAAIVHPVEQPGADELEADYLARIAAGAVPDGVAWQAIDVAAVSRDRTFRNAWRVVGASVKTDQAAAQLIAHDKRRASRSRELAPLDIQATIPAQAQAAEAARQAIRDRNAAVQLQIDAATTEAALLALVRALP